MTINTLKFTPIACLLAVLCLPLPALAAPTSNTDATASTKPTVVPNKQFRLCEKAVNCEVVWDQKAGVHRTQFKLDMGPESEWFNRTITARGLDDVDAATVNDNQKPTIINIIGRDENGEHEIECKEKICTVS